MKESLFATLSQINVNDHTEVLKTGYQELTYLSYAWAIKILRDHCPDAQIEVVKNDQGLPFFYDHDTDAGYMVYTRVTADGQTHEMWLPVMDSRNYAMKNHPYEVMTKKGKVTVQAATMMDINKAVNRCVCKCISIHFGLGYYLYTKDDAPEIQAPPITAEQIEEIKALGGNVAKITAWAGVPAMEQLTQEQAGIVLTSLRQAAEKAAAKAAEEKKKQEEEQKKKEEEQTRKEAEEMFDIPTEEETGQDPKYAPVLDDNGQEVDWEEAIKNV